MNPEQTITLLNRFIDSNREALKYPWRLEFNHKYYYVSSNGEVVLMIPITLKNLLKNDVLNTIDKYPNLLKIIPNFNLNIILDPKKFNGAYQDLPWVMSKIFKTCEACDGDGKFYHFGEFYKCKTCNENGKLETGLEEKVKDNNYAFKFREHIFSVTKIYSILNTAFYLSKHNNNELNISIIGANNTTIWFKLNDCIMCITNSVYDLDEENKPTKFIDLINLI